MSRTSLLFFGALAAAPLLPSSAGAAEVQFDGFYRARARAFQSLSLNSNLASGNEGGSNYLEHRLVLRPRFLLNEHVAAFTDIRGLDGARWGEQANTYFDPVAGEDVPRPFVDDLGAPAADGSRNFDLSIWHAWGEVSSSVGRFRFGRMPLQWGAGLWQNDGMGLELDPLSAGLPGVSDYGDTADRFSWEYLIDDTVFVMAAIDVNAEGFVNTRDDTTSYNAAVAYRSEGVEAGLLAQYRRVPDPKFGLFTIDGTTTATMGKLRLQLETVGRFGSGDLENGANEVSITSYAGMLNANLDLNPWYAGIEAGIASGDGNLADNRINTFTFDRDYNVALVLFEQPLPTLAAAAGTDLNDNRSFDTALTGNGLSNAMYVRPRFGRQVLDELTVDLAMVAARTTKVDPTIIGRRSYGMEFDLTAGYTPYDHFQLTAVLGVMLPGTWYRDYVDITDDTLKNFGDPVFAGQINARVVF